jgi:hypothetical protein
MNYLYLTFVLLGYIVALVLKPKNKTNLKLLLAFWILFLLLSFDNCTFPDVYESKDSNIGICIMMGFYSKLYWNFFSKGQNMDTYTDM